MNALPTNKAGEVKAQLDSMTELLSSMTEEQKALIPESTMAAYQEAVDAFEPGRQFCSGDGYYKVLSNGDVAYHHPADETITSAVVPNQVKKGKFLFKVIKVSNYAFDGCENLLWIVIHRNIRVIGEDPMMEDVLMEIVKDRVDEQVSVGKREQEQQTTVTHINDIMTKLKYTAEQAMDLLSIPQSQRSIYAGLVGKKTR